MQVPERCIEVPTHRQVLVVCKMGSRSARATAYLQAQGVDAVNLAGGMEAWAAAGRPMVNDTGSPPTVV